MERDMPIGILGVLVICSVLNPQAPSPGRAGTCDALGAAPMACVAPCDVGRARWWRPRGGIAHPTGSSSTYAALDRRRPAGSSMVGEPEPTFALFAVCALEGELLQV